MIFTNEYNRGYHIISLNREQKLLNLEHISNPLPFINKSFFKQFVEEPTDQKFLSSAVQIATNIIDPRLKARTLWLLSEHRRADGDQKGAKKIALLAMEKTHEIGSTFSQAWMFSSLAIEYAQNNKLDAGWAAFQNGIKIAKNIENSWNRARTLAKLATTMIILVDPGRGYQPVQK